MIRVAMCVGYIGEIESVNVYESVDLFSRAAVYGHGGFGAEYQIGEIIGGVSELFDV